MRTAPRSSSAGSPIGAALLLIFGWSLLSPPHAPAQLPSTGSLVVTITSPSSGSTVSGTISVNASVSIIGSLLVAGVQFKLDGSNLGAEDTSSPYSVSWNTTTTSNGSHTLTAVARDSLGVLWYSDPVSVTVSNADTTAPTVSITSPSGGSTVSGTISVSASASDNVGVVGVQFTLDGANLGAEDTSSPYSVSWNTTTTSNGSHTLTAVARDAAGNRTTSSGVTVTVSNADTTPPTVSITSPSGGSTVSGTISVSASASDNVGVVGVQFLLDGSALGAEDTSSPYSVSWNTTTTSNGSHTLTAVARDAAGNKTTSSGVTVTVSNGGPAPAPTRFEETAATLEPSGAWSEVTSAGAAATLSGDRAVFSSTAGATATFAFNGTSVTWIGLPCEICGIARVFVDGALAATVDTFAPSRPTASTGMFTASSLATGDHTLVIEATGTMNPSSGAANVVVDAYDVGGGSGGGTTDVTRFEEKDPAVSYSGEWLDSIRSDHSGGTAQKSALAGSRAAFTFTGTGVRWIGFKSSVTGIARVFLDGVLAAEVDTYSPSEVPQAVVFERTGLSSGSHTLAVEVTGTYNPSSTSAWIAVDAFDVMASSGTGPSPDATSPTVSLTSPSGGSTVSGTITVSASASDDVGVAGVQFLLDESALGSEDTTSPYAVAWDTTTASDGSHTLAAVARDAAGNRTTSAGVTVTVSNAPPPATRFEESAAMLAPATGWFGITSASEGVTLSGDFAVVAGETGATATFTFTGTGVSWIGFECEKCGIARVSLDGSVVATVDTYAPSRPSASGAMFTATGLAAGSHTIVIEMTGTKNASSLGAFIVVDAFDVR